MPYYDGKMKDDMLTTMKTLITISEMSMKNELKGEITAVKSELNIEIAKAMFSTVRTDPVSGRDQYITVQQRGQTELD
jgi:hypothetical protein